MVNIYLLRNGPLHFGLYILAAILPSALEFINFLIMNQNCRTSATKRLCVEYTLYMDFPFRIMSLWKLILWLSYIFFLLSYCREMFANMRAVAKYSVICIRRDQTFIDVYLRARFSKKRIFLVVAISFRLTEEKKKKISNNTRIMAQPSCVSVLLVLTIPIYICVLS